MKIISVIISVIVTLLFFITGEDVIITDVEQYGEVDANMDFPNFFPESVDDYTVNSYCYSEECYFNPCYELYLDITVTQKQFDSLLAQVKEYEGTYYEKQAYYADGYYEIVFDDYTTDTDEVPEKDSEEYDSYYIDGFTNIGKIVYNPDTLNIVFEYLDLLDAYSINRIVYFNRFDIDWNEYRIYMDLLCRDDCEMQNCNTYLQDTYDFIESNGTVYYLTDEEIDGLVDYANSIDVYLLEYDKERHNESVYTAYTFFNDTDINYIRFKDKIYTNNNHESSDYYSSYDFLKKFKKDEVRIDG